MNERLSRANRMERSSESVERRGPAEGNRAKGPGRGEPGEGVRSIVIERAKGSGLLRGRSAGEGVRSIVIACLSTA
jgi:hypothetical protein